VSSKNVGTAFHTTSRPTKVWGDEVFLSALRTNPVRKKLHTSAKLPQIIAIQE
jgi:hypothetical protein